jgi:hypothetical protein
MAEPLRQMLGRRTNREAVACGSVELDNALQRIVDGRTPSLVMNEAFDLSAMAWYEVA